VFALCVSISAFIVAVKNYLRKAGTFVRGSFSISSSVHSNGSYLSTLTLENIKDRAVTIFAIYLQIGSNYFLTIEDLTKKPLILRAFETHQQSYGPIEFYEVNTRRIDLEELLRSGKSRKRLVLSTSDGKYVVPSNLQRWNPIVHFFDNHLTAIITPVRSIYKTVPIGGTIKYFIEFTDSGGAEEIVPIHPDDFELKLFKTFQLTKESLETKDSLAAFLQQQVDAGKLVCKAFKVFDLEERRNTLAELFPGMPIKARPYSAFQYYVLGRLSTLYSNWQIRRTNRALAKGKKL